MKRKPLKIGDIVECVSGWDFRNGRAGQTGRITGVMMSWDDNSGTEEINPKDFKVVRKSKPTTVFK